MARLETPTRPWRWMRHGRKLTAAVVIALIGWHSIPAQQVSSQQYEVFRCRFKTAQEVARMLREILPEDETIHLVVDAQRNSILLRGPQRAIEIATELLPSVDQPPPEKQAPPEKQEQSASVQAYPCPASQQKDQITRLRARYAHLKDVRITADADTQRLFVLATPPIHRQIRQQLLAELQARPQRPLTRPLERPTRPATTPRPPTGPDTSGPPAGLTPSHRASPTRPVADGIRDTFLPLVSEPEDIKRRLTVLFGSRLQRTGPQADPIFRLKLDALTYVDFSFDWSRRGVRVTAHDRTLRQVVQLISALDQAGRDPAQRMSIVSIERTDPTQLRQTLDAYLDRKATQPPPNDSGDARAGRDHRVIPAAHLAFADGAAPIANGQTSTDAQPPRKRRGSRT